MQLILDTSPIRKTAGVNQACACKMAAITLLCVRTAPFDSPVVPPVYCKKAGSSRDCIDGLSEYLLPSSIIALNAINVRDLPAAVILGILYSGTIRAKCRTAKVIQRPNQKPSISPIEAITTFSIGVSWITSSRVWAKFSKITMVVAPESHNWCFNSRAV